MQSTLRTLMQRLPSGSILARVAPRNQRRPVYVSPARFTPVAFTFYIITIGVILSLPRATVRDRQGRIHTTTLVTSQLSRPLPFAAATPAQSVNAPPLATTEILQPWPVSSFTHLRGSSPPEPSGPDGNR